MYEDMFREAQDKKKDGEENPIDGAGEGGDPVEDLDDVLREEL